MPEAQQGLLQACLAACAMLSVPTGMVSGFLQRRPVTNPEGLSCSSLPPYRHLLMGSHTRWASKAQWPANPLLFVAKENGEASTCAFRSPFYNLPDQYQQLRKQRSDPWSRQISYTTNTVLEVELQLRWRQGWKQRRSKELCHCLIIKNWNCKLLTDSGFHLRFFSFTCTLLCTNESRNICKWCWGLQRLHSRFKDLLCLLVLGEKALSYSPALMSQVTSLDLEDNLLSHMQKRTTI